MILAPPSGNPARQAGVETDALLPGDFMRSCLLWLIGVPIPIIIILWLLTGHA
jgi:hypothetical protein